MPDALRERPVDIHTGFEPPQHEAGLYLFGPFVLDPLRRTLFRNGTRVMLTARLFETLLHLVRHPDRLVDREELERAVWPGRGVQAGNLQKAVSSLRKALEDGGPARTYIVTMPGRGFQFAVPVRFEPAGEDEDAPAPLLPVPLPPVRAEAAIVVPPRTAWSSRIALGLAVAVALAGSAAISWLGPRKATNAPPFAPPPHSVAVLPFANMSGDAKQDYFSDGLADDLINSLGRVAGLNVAARTSAFSFKGTKATIDEIGRRLDVGAVLEGSVRRDGQIVHIDVQLIDSHTGFPFWSRSYNQDRIVDDMQLVQRDIIKSVSASLDVKLLPGASEQLAEGGTHNAEAFDAYLRGVANNEAYDAVRGAQAVADFTEAITLDPAFAQAFAGRALAHNFLARADAARNKIEGAAAAADAAQAIKLAPMLVEAHRARALVMFNALDFRGAATEIGIACALAPDNALAEATRGSIEAQLGHVGPAISAARHALALDPLNPSAYRRLGQALYLTRRFDEALAAFGHASAVDKHPSRLAVSLPAATYLAMHEPAKAERLCADGVGWSDRVCLAMAYHALGRQSEAEAQFKALHEAFGDRAAYLYAEINAQWGRQNDALNWLEIAWALKDNGLVDLNVSPFLDPLRRTARFKELEHQLNFPT